MPQEHSPLCAVASFPGTSVPVMEAELLEGRAMSQPRLPPRSPQTLFWLLITPRARCSLALPPPSSEARILSPGSESQPGITSHHRDACGHLSRSKCQGGAGSPPGCNRGTDLQGCLGTEDSEAQDPPQPRDVWDSHAVAKGSGSGETQAPP